MFSTHFQGFSSHFQGATSLHPQHIAPTATYSLYRAQSHPKKPPAGGFCARSDSLPLLLFITNQNHFSYKESGLKALSTR